MRQVTELMINDFKIIQQGMDFMAYKVDSKRSLSFHHLIIPKRECSRRRIPNDGYVRENGAILVQKTSHDYLHRIEFVDPEIFYLITSEMVDENIKGRLDKDNLKRIHDLLTYFEREHSGARTASGKQLIKEEYTRRIKL